LSVRLEVVHVARLLGYAREPRFERGKVVHREPGLVRAVEVAEQRHIGDRVAATGEEVRMLQVPVEQTQDVDTAAPTVDCVGIVGQEAPGLEPEAQTAGHRDDRRLLVEEPAADVGEPFRVVRQQRRTRGEVDEDRARFGEEPSWRVLQHGRLPCRVHDGVLVRERVAGEDVDRDALVGHGQLGQEEAHLVTVGGGRVVVQAERAHAISAPSSRNSCSFRSRPPP
jgi:hypothetical protein